MDFEFRPMRSKVTTKTTSECAFLDWRDDRCRGTGRSDGRSPAEAWHRAFTCSLVTPTKEAMMVDGTKKSRHLSGCLDLTDHTSLGSVCCPLCLVCLCKYTPCLSELPGVEDIPPRPSSLPACPQPPMAFHACVCGPTKGNSTCYLFCCSLASMSLVSPSSPSLLSSSCPPLDIRAAGQRSLSHNSIAHHWTPAGQAGVMIWGGLIVM